MDRVLRMTLPADVAIEAILKDHLGEAGADLDLRLRARRALGSGGAECDKWARGARRRAQVENRAGTADDVLAEIANVDPRTETIRFRSAIH